VNQVYVALSVALPSVKRESLLVSKERNKQQSKNACIHGFDFLQSQVITRRPLCQCAQNARQGEYEIFKVRLYQGCRGMIFA